MIIGRLFFPPLEDVFGDVLPALRQAAKGPDPVREVTRLIRSHPEHKGVLLAYLSLAVARRTRNRDLALRVLRKAFRHLTDGYQGLLYANWCGAAVVLACQTPESIRYHQEMTAEDGFNCGREWAE